MTATARSPREPSAYLARTINARNLSPEQLAESFVRPHIFGSIWRDFNTVIVGNRGSGKTTLLKMLQLQALRAWRNPLAPKTRSRIGFSSVFIPTDRLWQEQLDSSRSIREMVNRPSALEAVGRAAFNLHVLSCFLQTVTDRIEFSRVVGSSTGSDHQLERFAIHIDKATEVAVSRALARAWRLSPEVPTFMGIRAELRAELYRLGSERAAAYRSGGTLSEDAALLADLDFFSALGAASDILSDAGVDRVNRWALCFDELEIAQEHVRQSVFGLFRSSDARFVVKATTTPFRERRSSYYELGGAEVDNDYELVDLRLDGRAEIRRFSEKLVTRIVKDEFESRLTRPEEVLGKSVMADTASGSRLDAAYPNIEVFKSLAAADPSFARYLRLHGLDLRDVRAAGDDKLHKTLRRVSSHAVTREAYRVGKPGGVSRLRDASVYSGVPLMYSICEGNPRLLINLTTLMLERRGHQHIVSPRIQAEVYRLASMRLLSLIKAAGAQERSGPKSLYELVLILGEYFAKRQLEDEFTAEPPGSVRLSPDDFARWGDTFALGENVGAFVELPGRRPTTSSVNASGTRYRLSFLLATQFRLAIRVDKSVALSAILDSAEESAEVTGQTRLDLA